MQRGFQKGHPNYNLNVSEETRRKISETNKRLGRKPPSQLGKHPSEETKRKIGLANSIALKGKKLPEEVKRKISEILKGRNISNEHKQKISDGRLKRKNRLGYLNSKETREKISEALKGEKSNLWQGGISFEPYTIDWTRTLKRAIRERDNYMCQICSQYGNYVHHIDYNKKNCDPNNLITLCHKCHSKTNFNRAYWKKYLKGRLVISCLT